MQLCHASFGLVVVLALGAAGAACSSGSNSNADACNAYISALYETTTRCYGSSFTPDALALQTKASLAECEAALALPGQGLTAASLKECASTLATDSCGHILAGGDCAPLLGTLPNGTPCNDDGQCQGGVCAFSVVVSGGGGDAGTTSSSSKCGVCAPTVAVGGDCSGGSSCVGGSECDGSKCVALRSVPTGGSCVTSLACASITDVCVLGKCGPAGDVGASCTSFEQCKLGLICALGSTGAGTRQCMTPIAAGGDCSKNTAGCGLGHYCDTAKNTCAQRTVVAPGAPCGPAALCIAGSCVVSDPSTGNGTCPALIEVGQPCDDSDKSKVCTLGTSCVGGACTGNIPTGSAVCK